MNELLVHADWGSNPKKRWMCLADIRGGSVVVDAPVRVGEVSTLWHRILHRAGSGTAVTVGFDFPIGVPRAYGESAGISDFASLLPRLGHGEWAAFYRPAEKPEEINSRRPFYPMRPGGTKQQHLFDGLGLSDRQALLRRCERPTDHRGPASPLFWTLGGKQVGKAAIIGWRDVIAPALASPMDVRLWPFDGELDELRAADTVTIVETYPAEACIHLGFDPPGSRWSKTSQAGRASKAAAIRAWAESRDVALKPRLQTLIDDGFGMAKEAEDPFDALLGLLGMVEVVRGHRPDGAPDDAAVRAVEGWILGQASA
ncbi:DUF429 domain-containing protein [Gemmatimonadota bacterium DH-20]|uniref:DUF429 domain-containing protein n=1 Tax=Gaopeijia maritima TaxID=3119007 RepID=A0ABU9EF83_9BACT